MRTPRLSADEIAASLASVPDWAIGDDGLLRRTFVFPGFPAAIRFVNAVADAAEAADHHPDIDIRYRRVTLALTTHDSGGLTWRDVDLARTIDALYNSQAIP